MAGKGVVGKESEGRSLRCLGMTAHSSVSLVPAWVPGADRDEAEKVGRSQSRRPMGIFLDSILWVKREGMLRYVFWEEHVDAENGLEKGKMGSREMSEVAVVLTHVTYQGLNLSSARVI